MGRYFILYGAAALIFFAFDFVWLTSLAKTIYQQEIGALLRPNPNLAVAAGFYLVYLFGLVVLVAAPAQGDVLKAVLMGALFGLVAYGTYDLTNLSTMNGFTVKIAIIDMAWGTVLTAISAGFAVWIGKIFA